MCSSACGTGVGSCTHPPRVRIGRSAIRRVCISTGMSACPLCCILKNPDDRTAAQKIVAFKEAFWKFLRPHTIRGTILGSSAVTAIALLENTGVRGVAWKGGVEGCSMQLRVLLASCHSAVPMLLLHVESCGCEDARCHASFPPPHPPACS